MWESDKGLVSFDKDEDANNYCTYHSVPKPGIPIMMSSKNGDRKYKFQIGYLPKNRTPGLYYILTASFLYLVSI